ncbi:MAG: phospholipase A [Hydrogenovibrio sp.]
MGLCLNGQAWANGENPKYDSACIQEAMETAPETTTLDEIRAACRITVNPAADFGALEKRLSEQRHFEYNQYLLQPYHANYILVGSYNFAGANEKPFDDSLLQDGASFTPTEIKFQVSLKMALTEKLFGESDRLYVGYTNRSFWQAYNGDISNPFRDSNHEPEVWMSFDADWRWQGVRLRLLDIGLSHQSNGQAGSLSRSWNRAYLRFVFETEKMAFFIEPWVRLPEAESDDDNPDIGHYMGNFELMGVYPLPKGELSFMGRDNFDFQDNKGALQLAYSYPIHRHLNLYVQWFYGYGESMIDYNYRNNRLGIGFKLGDWL